MIEGYVIKNKQNEYLDKHYDNFTKDLCSAKIFNSYRDAECFCQASCQVVEILLAERKDFLSKVFNETRKVLVEGIRKTLNNNCEYIQGGEYNGWYLSEAKLNHLLDKIEIGVKNEE